MPTRLLDGAATALVKPGPIGAQSELALWRVPVSSDAWQGLQKLVHAHICKHRAGRAVANEAPISRPWVVTSGRRRAVPPSIASVGRVSISVVLPRRSGRPVRKSSPASTWSEPAERLLPIESLANLLDIDHGCPTETIKRE